MFNHFCLLFVGNKPDVNENTPSTMTSMPHLDINSVKPANLPQTKSTVSKKPATSTLSTFSKSSAISTNTLPSAISTNTLPSAKVSESQGSLTDSQDSCYSGNVYTKWVPMAKAGSQPDITEMNDVIDMPIPDPMFEMLPRTFDVVLCVDNQEHYGGM